MELNVVNVIVVMLVCAMSAFLSHMGMAVFHDGIRPVIPEYIEGRMHRTEMASIAFGLSVGFIASVGIGNALVTNLLNPWLLFWPRTLSELPRLRNGWRRYWERFGVWYV